MRIAVKTKETVTAGGIVIHKKTRKVVLVNQNHNSWSLPKGHVDPGENCIEAAIREIYEECGIKSPELLGEAGQYKRYKIGLNSADDKTELKNMIFFVFETSETKLDPQDPHNPEAIWVDAKNISSKLTHNADKQFFENFQMKKPKLFIAK